jgi:DNA-binding IclR family transcriptional regulator
MNNTPGITRNADGREQIEGVPRLLVLAKAWNVLDAFSARTPELTVSELASRAGLPMSTCVRIVRNLAYDGILDRVGDRYRIGLSIVRWASLALAGRSLVDIASDTLEWLRDETGESAQLCVREGRFAVVVAVANSHHSVMRQLRVGEVNYLHAGSAGKVFLAFDPSAWDAIRSTRFESFTPNTPATRAELTHAVDAIRENGYAVSIGERNEGAAGVTAPIFDAAGRLVGVRMSPDTIDSHVQSVVEASRRITQQLGHAPLTEE